MRLLGVRLAELHARTCSPRGAVSCLERLLREFECPRPIVILSGGWTVFIPLWSVAQALLVCERRSCIVVNMRHGIVLAIAVIMMLVAIGLVNLTTPDMVGPLGVLAFFVCIYVAIMCLIYLALLLIHRISKKIAVSVNSRSRLENISSTKLYYYASVIALAPVILLGMQSVGVVGVFDLALLVLFEVLACFYIAKRF